jgi:sensor c-di-GMP phosphodiesterase-like protein
MLKPALTAAAPTSFPLREVLVAFPKPKEWLAILIGVALATLPMVAFNLWLGWFIEQRGSERVEQVAKRSLAVADRRADLVVDTLGDLAAQGVGGCTPADIEVLRTANFWTIPIKEVSVLDGAGKTLCTDLGIPLGERVVLSAHPLTPDGAVAIEVLRLEDRQVAHQAAHIDAMVRIRRVEAGGGNALAALMPAELLLPLASMPREVALGTILAITTRDGSALSEGGVSRPGAKDEKDRFVATMSSERYNFVATAALPRARVMAEYGNLRTVGTAISGAMSLAIIAFALILPARRRDDPIGEIERALDAGELVPYFQPVVDITNGRLRGAEVLVRWRKPDGSLVLPAAFIPLLESSNLIIDVTRMLMRRVRDEIGPAYSRRPKLKIGFNLAAAHFADETIVADVRETFENSPIRLSQIMLELTERQPLENLTETRRIIAALQGLGVGIAIDDVGTGHSGLSYMLKLGVDTIKIDKIFIDAIGTERNSATIIETLIELARNLRMDIVAEGVESFEQVIALRDLGIRAAQGYVFAPALPASSFLQLIEAIDPLPQPASRPATVPPGVPSRGSAAA